MVEILDQRQYTDLCGRVWPGINSLMQEARVQGNPISHVLILAGTNDLASERYGFRAAQDILKVYDHGGSRDESVLRHYCRTLLGCIGRFRIRRVFLASLTPSHTHAPPSPRMPRLVCRARCRTSSSLLPPSGFPAPLLRDHAPTV